MAINSERISDVWLAENALDHGAKGDGTTNDTTALQAALTAAGAASPVIDLILPPGIYMCQGLVVPDGVTVIGFGDKSILKKRANGAVISLGTESNLLNIAIEGNGASFTGVGVTIPATTEFNGKQRIINCKINDTASYCVEYSAEYAGYYSLIEGCRLKPTSLTTYSVKWGVETLSSHHGNRNIVGCQSNGPIVDASGSQNGIVVGCQSGGSGTAAILTDANSAKIIIVGNRFGSTGQTITLEGAAHIYSGNSQVGTTVLGANSDVCTVSGNTTGNLSITAGGDGHSVMGNVCSALTIAGNANTISGNRCSGALTLSAGAQTNVVGSNYAASYADNSASVGSNANHFDIPLTTYVPTWTSTGTAPALGDGTATGRYSRHGTTVTATILFTAGSTSTYGSGNYYWALPFIPGGTVIYTGAAKILDSGTAHFQANVQTLSDGTARAVAYTTAIAGVSVPMTWATGDTLTATITYEM